MKHVLCIVAAVGLASPALAHGDHCHDHDHVHEEVRYRLLVADAEAPSVHVVDVDGEANARLETASPAHLYLGPDGRHAFAVQRDAWTPGRSTPQNSRWAAGCGTRRKAGI